MKAVRLAYLVTHPIQYQAPLLRRIAEEPGIDFHVLFMSDFSVRAYFDEGFGREIKWDVPLTDGYSHEFLPHKPGAGKSLTDDLRTTGLTRAIDRRKYDVLWSHGYSHRTNLVSLLLARRSGIKTLIRSENQPFATQRSPGIRGKLKDRGVRHVLKLGDAFLSIGTLNRRYYEDHGVPSKRIFDMPYAIDNDRFRAQAVAQTPNREILRASLGLAPGRPVILFASKLQTRKRVLDLVSAYKISISRLPARPYLVIVGDGEDRAALEKAVKDAGLGVDVKLLGFMNQTELPAMFDLCDVFVLPSAREQWGLVVNEVMCAGKAVIVANEVGSGTDLVRHGENGFIFNVGDIEALANALCSVLESPERSRQMGEVSWDIVKSWDFNADIAGLRQALDYVLR